MWVSYCVCVHVPALQPEQGRERARDRKRKSERARERKREREREKERKGKREVGKGGESVCVKEKVYAVS